MAVLDVGQIGANIYTPSNNAIRLSSTFNRLDNYTICESVMDKTVTINMQLTSLQELTADKEYTIGYIQISKLFPKMNVPLFFRSEGTVIVGSVDKSGISTNGRLLMVCKSNIPANTTIYVNACYTIGG